MAAVLGNQIVVCGGFDGHRQLDVAERFDPVAGLEPFQALRVAPGTWQQLPAMHCRRLGLEIKRLKRLVVTNSLVGVDARRSGATAAVVQGR